MTITEIQNRVAYLLISITILDDFNSHYTLYDIREAQNT